MSRLDFPRHPTPAASADGELVDVIDHLARCHVVDPADRAHGWSLYCALRASALQGNGVAFGHALGDIMDWSDRMRGAESTARGES